MLFTKIKYKKSDCIHELENLRGGACGIIIAGADSLSCDSKATWSDSFSGSLLSAEIAFTTSTASSAAKIYKINMNLIIIVDLKKKVVISSESNEIKNDEK